jgi:hypothetical protein
MTLPIKIGIGSVEVINSRQNKFKTRDNMLDIIPKELSASWMAVKQLADGIVEQQLTRSRLVDSQNAKISMIKRIYEALCRHDVDENVLVNEVLKTGEFSQEEAKSSIKKLIEDRKINIDKMEYLGEDGPISMF